MTFQGLGEEAVEFYEGLEADNSKSYWTAHKPVYDRAVAGPMLALAAALEPEFGDSKVFRPYRDVRFSNEKTPYKTHAALVLGSMHSGALYMQFSLQGVMVAGGFYDPARDQLDRWRRLQDEPTITRELDALVERMATAGYPLGDGDPLKTAPRGWAKDHPRIDLLRRRRLEAGATHELGPWVHTDELLDVVTDGFRTLRLWNTWLCERVGLSNEVISAPE
jgi:uncharacterized protein (TIGR02453 family)